MALSSFKTDPAMGRELKKRVWDEEEQGGNDVLTCGFQFGNGNV